MILSLTLIYHKSTKFVSIQLPNWRKLQKRFGSPKRSWKSADRETANRESKIRSFWRSNTNKVQKRWHSPCRKKIWRKVAKRRRNEAKLKLRKELFRYCRRNPDFQESKFLFLFIGSKYLTSEQTCLQKIGCRTGFLLFSCESRQVSLDRIFSDRETE